MWYSVENGEAVRPAEIDSTSSRAYVYIRRSIELIESTEDTPAHYAWEEMKIPREAWGMAELAMGNSAALEDVYAALAELAGIIAEV